MKVAFTRLALQHSSPGAVRGGARPGFALMVAGVVGLALAVRVGLAALITWLNAPAPARGLWLDDEAAYHLASVALLPDPLGRQLPPGLEHLSGNGYLGLSTAVYLLTGPSPLALRLANAALGSLVVLLALWQARALFGPRAGLLAGLLAALWPSLVLWSATILRDTLVSLAVMALWWATRRWAPGARLRPASATLFALLLLAGLRWYAFLLAALGLLAWAAWPWVRRRPRLLLGAAGLGAATLALALAVAQPSALDQLTRTVAKRQAMARLEALGTLYVDQPESTPLGRGALVALDEPRAPGPLLGVVQQHAGPDTELVAFTDQTQRLVPTRALTPFAAVRLPPWQPLQELPENSVAVLAGYAPGRGQVWSQAAWIADALLWDGLLLLALLAVWRWRHHPRPFLFPLALVLGTLAVLAVVPGAPGNAARHRAAQATPLLLVLASAALAPAVAPPTRSPAPGAKTASSSPAVATPAASSRKRSDC